LLPIEFVMKAVMPASAKRKDKKRAAAPAKRKRRDKLERSGRPGSAIKIRHAESDSGIEGALRELRQSEARRRRVPAFRIFSDKALKAIASQRPQTAHEYLPSQESESPPLRSMVNRYTAS
jgi:DNA topoisomerase III